MFRLLNTKSQFVGDFVNRESAIEHQLSLRQQGISTVLVDSHKCFRKKQSRGQLLSTVYGSKKEVVGYLYK